MDFVVNYLRKTAKKEFVKYVQSYEFDYVRDAISNRFLLLLDIEQGNCSVDNRAL
jgi:hypothetical protein